MKLFFCLAAAWAATSCFAIARTALENSALDQMKQALRTLESAPAK